MLKGYLRDFSPEAEEVLLDENPGTKAHRVLIDEVKAIFFVRSFSGDRSHKEKKTYGQAKPKGQRLFIKFSDGESLVGYLDGEVPWEKGFFLSKKDRSRRGFFLYPVDEDTNNIRVFVVASSLLDATVVPQ